MYYKLICIFICTPIWTKKFILVKSGCYKEVAVTEWIRGANPVSCKWVKQEGPTKGFNFDESKVNQIVDLLLREKQLKLL
jgi:hypothetical protein